MMSINLKAGFMNSHQCKRNTVKQSEAKNHGQFWYVQGMSTTANTSGASSAATLATDGLR